MENDLRKIRFFQEEISMVNAVEKKVILATKFYCKFHNFKNYKFLKTI